MLAFLLAGGDVRLVCGLNVLAQLYHEPEKDCLMEVRGAECSESFETASGERHGFDCHVRQAIQRRLVDGAHGVVDEERREQHGQRKNLDVVCFALGVRTQALYGGCGQPACTHWA